MRYAMIPLTSTVMNIKTESDFLSSKHLIEEAVRQGRGYFYFCLCEDHKKYLGIRNTPGITYLYNPERTEFYYQSSFVPTNFIELFNPVLGRYYVDGVITSRSGAAAIMSKLLWDKRVEDPEIPVIVIENKVSAIGGTHNVMCYEDLILRASGYAVSCNFFATEREKKLALEMCREFLSPSALKRVIENSHVVYHGINCDEIEEVGKRTPKAEKFTLLYSGRLTSNKQWKKVLLDYKKFFSFGRDLDLVVCAPLGSTEVDRALKILGTWGEVNLGLPRKDYLEKLVSSHVCLSNSLEEGGTVGFCYDDQTEILTEKGWKKFSDLRKEDKVLTMNPINSLAEFKKPDKFFKIDFDGYLYEYEEKTINFAVTPGHKMFVRKGGKNEYELMSIEDVIKYKNVFVTSVMFWKGKVREFFYLRKPLLPLMLAGFVHCVFSCMEYSSLPQVSLLLFSDGLYTFLVFH